jgi:large subunit ribosomal protein L3
MLDTIIGIKQKMGAVYLKDRRFPVTWVKVDPCIVTQVKHLEKDGYAAVQLGTGSKKDKYLTKPLIGHLKKITKDNKSPRYLREIRIKEDSDLKVSDEVKLTEVLKKGDMVTVTGTSKGKGFAGVVKRWGFAGGPKTHGQSDRERAPGSIGQRTTPGRVYKGKKMAGRMGQDRVTVKSLVVVDIDEKNNLVAITGAVPGVNGGLVYIKKTGESRLKAQLNEETKKVENEESIDKAQDRQVEPSSAETSSDANAMEDKSVDKQEEVKEEIKKEENELMKATVSSSEASEKTGNKEVVKEVHSKEVKKSEELNTEVAK